MKAGLYYLQYGHRPGVQCGYRLCTYCLGQGVERRGTHVIVHPWWKFKWSDVVCDDCAATADQSSADEVKK